MNECMDLLKYAQLFFLCATHSGKRTLKTLLESVVLICSEKVKGKDPVHSFNLKALLMHAHLEADIITNNCTYVLAEIALLYRHECFTGKYTNRKIHKNYIRDPKCLFSIISHVSLSIT